MGTEATIAWADQKLETVFESLPQRGLGDTQQLLRTIGSRSTVDGPLARQRDGAAPVGSRRSSIRPGVRREEGALLDLDQQARVTWVFPSGGFGLLGIDGPAKAALGAIGGVEDLLPTGVADD